jgi:hypothetical protein
MVARQNLGHMDFAVLVIAFAAHLVTTHGEHAPTKGAGLEPFPGGIADHQVPAIGSYDLGFEVHGNEILGEGWAVGHGRSL